MSERLARFLVSLAQDPHQVEDFWEDPEPVLAEADLSEEDKAIVRSGEAERIRLAFTNRNWPIMAQSSGPHPKPPPPPPPPPPPGPKPPPNKGEQ